MRRRRSWWAGLAGVLLLGLSAVLLAERGVVVTRDGTSYEGEVREEEQEIIILSRGIETRIPRADVVRIDYKDYDQEFRERLAQLDPTDIPGRIALARSAFDRRRYDLAREALNDALRVDPNDRQATDMLDLVERTMRLERAAPAQPAAAQTDPGAVQPPAPPPGRPAPERRLLSMEDINLIRQKELKRSDTGVRITFQGDVKKRFTQVQNIPFAQFNRLPPVEQAIEILDKGDEDMRRQVRITSDPSALAEYKRFVQPVVLGGCATSGCHGGPGGGSLILYSPADSDSVAYTNFYIMTQFASRTQGRPAQGIFGLAMRRLIERGHGESSLLANFGLPVTIAEHDHPPVGGKPVQPIFRNKQDSRYQQIVNWMNNSLLRIEPDYGIDFPLPRATTQPATQPEREGDEGTR